MKNVYTASRINDRSIRDALHPTRASPSTRQESQESLVLVPPIMSSRGRWPCSSRTRGDVWWRRSKRRGNRQRPWEPAWYVSCLPVCTGRSRKPGSYGNQRVTLTGNALGNQSSVAPLVSTRLPRKINEARKIIMEINRQLLMGTCLL